MMREILMDAKERVEAKKSTWRNTCLSPFPKKLAVGRNNVRAFHKAVPLRPVHTDTGSSCLGQLEQNKLPGEVLKEATQSIWLQLLFPLHNSETAMHRQETKGLRDILAVSSSSASKDLRLLCLSP